MKSSGPGAVDVELVKAAAQAWYAHSGNPRASDDGSHVAGGVRRAAARYRPSRFKLEADAAAASGRPPWDFTQSLWDTYELVAVAQKIESCLLITDKPPPPPRYAAKEAATAAGRGGGKRARESKRSIRSLLFRSSPRRFQDSST